jgi:hypothetical protein
MLTLPVVADVVITLLWSGATGTLSGVVGVALLSGGGWTLALSIGCWLASSQ